MIFHPWGQIDFIEKLFADTNRILGTQAGGVRKASSKRKDFYTCSWGSKDDVMKIFTWMYENCGNLYQERKRCVFEKWLRIINEKDCKKA